MSTPTTKVLALVASLCLISSVQAGTIETIDARTGYGLTPDGAGFPAFFAGFAGGTSYTNTTSFTDGVVQMDLDMTVEGFDFNGTPANLVVSNTATGIEVGVDNMRLDTGERVKVTYNSITFSNVGPAPAGMVVDPSSYNAILDTVRLTSYDVGTDQYSYAGVGTVTNAVPIGTTQIDLEIFEPISDGDMFNITAVGGAFRLLFSSQQAQYETIPIPEPATLGLMTLSMVGILASRRRR